MADPGTPSLPHARGRLIADLWRLVALAPGRERRALALAIGFTVLASLADVFSFAVLKAVLTGGASALTSAHAASLTAFVLAALTGSLLRLAALRQTIKAQYGIASALAVIAFGRLQRQDYAEFLRAGASQGHATFERLNMIAFQALAPLIAGMAAACSVVLMLIGLAVVQPEIGLACAVVALLVAVIRPGRSRAGVPQGLSRLIAERARLLHECRAGFRDVFLTNGQDRLIEDFAAIDSELRQRQAAEMLAAQSARHVLELGGFTAALAALAVLPLLGASTAALVPVLGLLALAGLRLLPHLAALRTAWRTIAAHGQVTGDVLDLLTVRPAPVDGGVAVAAGHAIELAGITVSRPGRPAPLRELSLTIPPGARIGIAGPSGAGKSTLLDVLAGAIAPDCGQVLVDGAPLTASSGAAWRERVGFVSQNPVLLGATLREAVVFPQRPEQADSDRFDSAIGLSGVAAMAADFALGLDTPVGEAVEHLSGGQRQRLAIAHALYRARDLLLLDEATGQLDPASEQALVGIICALPASLRVVLVSHRPALFACCDTVYELRGGQLWPGADPAFSAS